MSTYVRYMVPVLVEVDLDRDAVVGVQVDDERVAGPIEVFSVDRGVSDRDALRASEVAERADWPMWEFGG